MSQFKTWFEVVAGRQITANQPVRLSHIDPEQNWDVAGQVQMIAKNVGIRPNSQKDVSIVATVGQTVIGGVFDEIYEDTDAHEAGYPHSMIYDFDVVVSHDWQGYQNVGLKLIDAAMQKAHSEEFVHAIRVWVVNPRLRPYLQNKYDFEGNEIMYKYI